MVDAYKQKQNIFGGFSLDYDMATTDTTKNFIAAKSSTAKFAVQKLKVVVLVGNAGKTLTLGSQDGAVALTPALDMSTAGVEYSFDYGPKGKRFATAGDAIKGTISAAGAAAFVCAEGYWLVP